LINKLNYINFQNKTVLLAFEHAKYGHTLRVEARPQPCRENLLRCTWVDPQEARAVSRYYVFSSLFVPDEQKLLQGIGQVISMDEGGIVIELPKTCTEVQSRRVVRNPCTGIQVQLLKSGSRFEGTLVDFSPISFRTRLRTTPPQTFGWLTTGAPVMVVLSNDKELLFSGDCRMAVSSRAFVLARPPLPISTKFSPESPQVAHSMCRSSAFSPTYSPTT
jgi:hypothetical protein